MIGPILRFFPAWWQSMHRRAVDRVRAARASFSFEPGDFVDLQFLRYTHYSMLRSQLRTTFGDGTGLKALELGGSNQVIARMLPAWDYEIAPNFPEVDVHDLSRYADGSLDVVVVDQVLEHVRDPARAVAEMHRILKPGGWAIATTPFLIEIHGYPDDWRRFTPTALRALFSDFHVVDVSTWGNRFTVKTIARHGWLTSRNTRRLLAVALWNEPEWPIDVMTVARK